MSDTIKDSQEFITPAGLKKWVGKEHTLIPGENEDEAMQKVVDWVNKWGNPFHNLDTGYGPGVQPASTTELPTINHREQLILDLIVEADTVEVLKSYAKDCNTVTTQAAYAKRYKELTNG